MEQVSWEDCRKLLARSGLVLPTEAQWEYAARAGTRSTWWTGSDPAMLEAAGNVATQSWADGYAVHAPVGRFLPNPLGLHDVIGNVFEWCLDPYVKEAYGKKLPAKMPEGWRDYPDEALRGARVPRGGSWVGPALLARSALRTGYAPSVRDNDLGCRPARRIH